MGKGPLVGNGGARIRSPASSGLPCERARQARTAAGLKLNHDVEQRAEALFHFVFGPDDSASGIEEFDQVRVAATAFVQVAEVALHLFQSPGAVRISLECGQERGMRGNFGNKCVHVRVHLVHLRSAEFLAASKDLDGFCAMHKNVILLHKVYGAGGASAPQRPKSRGRRSSRLAVPQNRLDSHRVAFLAHVLQAGPGAGFLASSSWIPRASFRPACARP
jgi:hypothetical protein